MNNAADQKFFVVGIGASAGGLDALRKFFHQVPEDINAAFVVVTHLSRDFESQLALLLSKETTMPVLRIKGGEKVKPAHIYVMPEGKEVTIEDGKLHLSNRGLNSQINHAIDRFFISLGRDQQERSVGIILSGAGDDGAVGVEYLSKSGGSVYVQDPKTSQFSSMPREAIEADHPELVESPEVLGRLLQCTLHHSGELITKFNDENMLIR